MSFWIILVLALADVAALVWFHRRRGAADRAARIEGFRIARKRLRGGQLSAEIAQLRDLARELNAAAGRLAAAEVADARTAATVERIITSPPPPVPAPAGDRESGEELTQVQPRPMLPAPPPTDAEREVLAALGRLQERAGLAGLATIGNATKLLGMGREARRTSADVVGVVLALSERIGLRGYQNLTQREIGSILVGRLIGVAGDVDQHGRTAAAPPEPAGAA